MHNEKPIKKNPKSIEIRNRPSLNKIITLVCKTNRYRWGTYNHCGTDAKPSSGTCKMWNNKETKQKETKYIETKRNLPKQTKIKTKRNELKPKSFCLKTVDIYWWSTLVIHYCSIFSKKVIIKQSFLELWFMHMMHDERNLFYNTHVHVLLCFVVLHALVLPITVQFIGK